MPGQKPASAIALRTLCSRAKIRFVLTTPLRSYHPIAQHIHQHGDAVRGVALWVDDARHAWHETTSRGAISVDEPHMVSDEHGTAVLASIRTYGDTIAHICRTQRLYRARFCRATAPLMTIRLRVLSACFTSTTWWATWAGTRWTSGSTSMQRSWASRSISTSMTRTSPPNTPR